MSAAILAFSPLELNTFHTGVFDIFAPDAFYIRDMLEYC